jgi:hypothetical protein
MVPGVSVTGRASSMIAGFCYPGQKGGVRASGDGCHCLLKDDHVVIGSRRKEEQKATEAEGYSGRRPTHGRSVGIWLQSFCALPQRASRQAQRVRTV